MKNNMMKKFLTMTLACAMTLSLAACGSKAESPADSPADQNTAAPIETDTKAYKVAIIKQLDHASLDEIANAVTAELDQISADKNVKIEYEVTSGQGDQTILKQLSDQAIADGVDAIIPIATTAAQVAAVSAGIVDDVPLLDLCYEEDSGAMVDLNCVMDDQGRLIEIQGTGEERPFTLDEQRQLVELCEKGIRRLQTVQRAVLEG